MSSSIAQQINRTKAPPEIKKKLLDIILAAGEPLDFFDEWGLYYPQLVLGYTYADVTIDSTGKISVYPQAIYNISSPEVLVRVLEILRDNQ